MCLGCFLNRHTHMASTSATQSHSIAAALGTETRAVRARIVDDLREVWLGVACGLLQVLEERAAAELVPQLRREMLEVINAR